MSSKYFAKFTEQKNAFDAERRAIDAERRALDLKSEQRQTALLASWRAHYYGQDSELLGKAIAALRAGAKALAAVGPAPAKPDVGTMPVDEFVSAATEYPAVERRWREARIVAGLTVAATLKALDHDASCMKRECRELGLPAMGGAGLLGEHHLHGRHGLYDRNSLEQAIARLEQGYYGAEDCTGLAAFLAIPAPEAQAPSPTYPGGIAREPVESAALGFERISRAAAEREFAANLPPRAPFRGEQDADKYIRTMTSGLPLMTTTPKANL